MKSINIQDQFLNQLKSLMDNAKEKEPKDLISSLQQLRHCTANPDFNCAMRTNN